MSEKTVIDVQIDMLVALMKSEGPMTNTEISLYFAGAGVSGKSSRSNIISTAFKRGITRRKKVKGSNCYEYRLAYRYPKFGISYEETPRNQRPQEDIVAKCKRASNVWQFDQLLKSARGGHAPAN